MDYIAYFFISIGAISYLLSVIGVFKMNYVLNRMHVAAIGDTLGMTLIFIGLIIIEGFNFNTLKIITVLVFMMLTGPISGHLISKLVYITDDTLKEHCDISETEDKNDSI